MTQPDWPAADRAYQAHHTSCPQCRAAAHAAAVAGHVLIGVVFHLAPSAGFAATGAVQISSAVRSRTS